jgi:Uma2 family endonuclease
VQRNLLTALASRLRGGPCEAFGSELKIIVAGRVRYPDAFVIRSHVSDKATFVTDPVVVFEIISPSTSTIDRITKVQEYRDNPAIQRYVILEQDRLAATVFSRDHGDWVGHVIAGDVELALPEVGISIILQELYTGVELAVEPPPEQASEILVG